MIVIRDLKNTHPAIYNRILELQIANGHKPNDSLRIGDDSSMGNFWWSSTEEGFDVWDRVDSGDFDSWYEHHGLNARTITDKKPVSRWAVFFEYLPSVLRLIGLGFVSVNIDIILDNNNLWIVPVTLFGAAELIDLFKFQNRK